MSVNFGLSTGEQLALQPGLPQGYNGDIIRGATIAHVTAAFGQIILQEVRSNYVSFRKLFVHWKRPERILCDYNCLPGVFTRTALDNPLHEYIKGGGRIDLGKEEFASLSGNSWKSVIISEKAGGHSFIEMEWATAFLEETLVNDPKLNEALHQIYPGFPERLIGPVRSAGFNMKQILGILQDVDYSSLKSMEFFHEQMRKYFSLVLGKSEYFESAKNNIRQHDWNTILKAKDLIDRNPDRHFTIPEISLLIGMNEFKLKKLFPKITGFKIDAYRKYQLCVRAGKEMLVSGKAVKCFSKDAGYTSCSAFARGFRKILYCTPAELKAETWDLSTLPKTFAITATIE